MITILRQQLRSCGQGKQNSAYRLVGFFFFSKKTCIIKNTLEILKENDKAFF